MVTELFFDLETTGLPKNYKAPITDKKNYPHIVQIAWILFADKKEVSCNDIIIRPDNFTIPKESTKIHGITQEIATTQGFPINWALLQFTNAIEILTQPVDKVIAHNLNFDKNVLLANIYREIELDQTFFFDNCINICSMESTTNLLKLPGNYGYKWPKLQELHQYLFGSTFKDAHDALADIRATARCYYELERRGHKWIS